MTLLEKAKEAKYIAIDNQNYAIASACRNLEKSISGGNPIEDEDIIEILDGLIGLIESTKENS